MNSREKILSTVKQNQPPFKPLPELPQAAGTNDDLQAKFIATLISIGGNAQVIKDVSEIPGIVRQQNPDIKRIVAYGPLDVDGIEKADPASDPHFLSTTDLGIIRAEFGVAENGAVWVREHEMGLRVLPYISQHLAVIIPAGAIVVNMHKAYECTAGEDYGFGGFIAGPSKTADIEQSLVLGAHGPLSMTAFLLEE